LEAVGINNINNEQEISQELGITGTSSSNTVISRIHDVGMFVKVDGNITDYEKHIVSSYNLYYAKFCIVNLTAVHFLQIHGFRMLLTHFLY